MKKRFLVIFSIIAVAIGVGLNSCKCENGTLKKLKSDIRIANAQCPQNCGIVGDLLGIEYDENTKEVQTFVCRVRDEERDVRSDSRSFYAKPY